MMWQPCILQKKVKTGEDQLGNAVYDWIDVARTTARFTPWTDEQTALEDREVTRNEQRFVIPIPYSFFPECDRAVLNGCKHDIKQRIDLSPRYTVIQVRVYKE